MHEVDELFIISFYHTSAADYQFTLATYNVGCIGRNHVNDLAKSRQGHTLSSRVSSRRCASTPPPPPPSPSPQSHHHHYYYYY
ncbi:hypothetical protein M0802_004179 [Mischocyttarus mexicanus]|nr:hypothetical protein M0802_004179 [Mischocyttarus mexicanus]